MVHACVFRTCAASTEREEAGWSGDIRGEGGGGLEGKRRRPRHPYNEERGRGKKRRLICRPRTSPIRVLFVPPAIFLFHPLPLSSIPGMYTWTVRFSKGGEEQGQGDRRDGSFLEKGSRDNRVKLHLRVLWNGNKFPRGGPLLEEERFEYFSMFGLVFFYWGSMRKVKRNFWYL